MAAVLATPMLPSAVYSPGPGDDSIQYRPAKNLEAFNSLLPPAIEFVEGSSTGILAGVEGKYEPINASPKLSTSGAEVNGKIKHTPAKLRKSPASPTQPTHQRSSESSLYTLSIDTAWPAQVNVGVGLFNTGNTCFLNSALQCLMHTPPLLQVLNSHSKADPCRVKNNNFCMSCALRQLSLETFRRSRAFAPSVITQHLHHIAKHMRRGRQEDSHEFLRYAIDCLQKSCLAALPPKPDPKLAETTWVHKVFGGRLRSRVTCTQCGHNSDTFDRILDLSLDIGGGVSGVKEALRRFTAVDYLKGADKYKCDKCKRAVNAEKRFTIHEAPMVLTIHLKRFTPMGRKVTNPIRYDERLGIQPYMSDGHYGPSYALYGVISHMGGGPNSGHYYAHVKAANGRWYEMNDSTVEPERGAPLSMKNAYILFYLREKGQRLESIVKSNGAVSPQSHDVHQQHKHGQLVNGMSKKRKIIESDDEDSEKEKRKMAKEGDKGKPFIGPLLPDSATHHKRHESHKPSHHDSSPIMAKRPDPQAEMLKAKIQAVRRRDGTPTPKKALVDYGEDDDDIGVPIDRSSAPPPPPSSQLSGATSPAVTPPSPIASSPPPAPAPQPSAIPSVSFYGVPTVKQSSSHIANGNSHKKDDLNRPPNPQRRSSKGSESGLSISSAFGISNPFNRITGGGNSFGRKSESANPYQPRKLQKQYGKPRRKILI